MANKKLNNEKIQEILHKFDEGESPANLAKSYGVHSTTMRRYLRQNGRELSRIASTNEIDVEVKLQLRKVLMQFNVQNVDTIISELSKSFNIEKKSEEKDEDFQVIHL